MARAALEGKGPRRWPQKRLDRRSEGVAKAVGGGNCPLHMPLKLAPAVREAVAGPRLGTLGRGWVGNPPPPPSNASLHMTRVNCVLLCHFMTPPPPRHAHVMARSARHTHTHAQTRARRCDLAEGIPTAICSRRPHKHTCARAAVRCVHWHTTERCRITCAPEGARSHSSLAKGVVCPAEFPSRWGSHSGRVLSIAVSARTADPQRSSSPQTGTRR